MERLHEDTIDGRAFQCKCAESPNMYSTACGCSPVALVCLGLHFRGKAGRNQAACKLKSEPARSHPADGPGTRPSHPAWAPEWVRKFRDTLERRFGAGAEPSAERGEAFVRFIAERWQTPNWQQAQARTALQEWLEPVGAGAARRRPGDGGTRPAPVSAGAGQSRPPPPSGKPGLAGRCSSCKEAIRLKHYSQRTEETYVHWLRQDWGFLQGQKKKKKKKKQCCRKRCGGCCGNMSRPSGGCTRRI